MATFQVAPPEPFTFTRPEEWTKWIHRFERYRIASGLDRKPEATQVNTLIYAMGDEADDILRQFSLSEADKAKYVPVKEQFDKHFVKRRNVIFERAEFNMRRQEEGEPVDVFITALYSLAEHCGYGNLHDEMIRDRIVVGICNSALAKKLQLDPDLTLEKAVTQVRQAEAVKMQQPLIRGHSGAKPDTPVGAVSYGTNKAKQLYKGVPNRAQPARSQCSWCGKCPTHDRQHCPAKEAVCHKCRKRGHFQVVCRSSANVSRVQSQRDSSDGLQDVFLGAVKKSEQAHNLWLVNLKLGKKSIHFHIDTRAEVTVISEAVWKDIGQPPLSPSNRTLRCPDTHVLPSQGKFKGKLIADTRQIEEEIYVIKGLDQPLLGQPAIKELGLVQRVAVINNHKPNAMEQFPALFQGLGKLEGEYSIQLEEGAKPYALSTPRRVAIPLLEPVRLGVIARVEEPTEWCAGLVVVPKANGKVRICVNLTQLNQHVRKEKHPLPVVDQTLAQLAGAKIFTKLDANSGFWQIPLSPESALLTTFITPFGCFCFHRLPFGITSGPEHFQRRMSSILSGLEGAVGMIDDVLVHGRTREEHDKRLHKVLQRLQETGITLNSEKCKFSKTSVKFLGHVIDASGIRPDPEKLEAIRKVQTPANVGDVRRFLGMVNQMSKFAPNLADITQPLRELLIKDNQWVWGEPQRRAFNQIKDVLTSSPVLVLYDPNLKTIVSADASSFGLGAVLMQKQPNTEPKPVAFISRSMTPTEQRYAQIEKEALAFTWACERLADYLVGLEFQIQTDHKPLVPLFSSKHLEDLPIRVQRFRLRMMRFRFSIIHVPGKDLVIADALSRAPVAKPTTEDELLQLEASAFIKVIVQSLPATEQRLDEIKEHQQADETCQQIAVFCQSGWPVKQSLTPALKQYYSMAAKISVSDGLLMRGGRLVIPPSLRQELLRKIHTGHQGITKCREKARQSIWWPGISTEIEQMVRTCSECCKAQNQRAQPLIPSPLPELPWQKVATDLFEWKQEMFLLMVDYSSRYIEIARLSQSTTEEVITHTKSVFARHGIPEVVVSDNGPQYTAGAYSKFAQEYQFEHVTSSPYFPQSNGEAERAVGTIKSLLKKCDDPYLALLSYRTTPLQIGYSPSELLMNRVLRSTVPTTRSQRAPRVPDPEVVRAHDQKLKAQQKKNFDHHHGAHDLPPLEPGDTVWLPDREEEARVDREVGPQSFQVTTSEGSYRRNQRNIIQLPHSADPPREAPIEETTNASDQQATFVPPPSQLQETQPRRSTRTSEAPARLDPSWTN